ncbi:MAG: UDP-N-acetylglucosamine 2-epimerase (hydrolyzing) [Acidobacteria bacterium]|nr:UDP-N-acetylglucosamine 2-epimerase (hydrolyzing) [Acidobacteriota bacterium]
MRTIAVVTTSRADYSHLYWVLRELDASESIELRLIVAGAHLSPAFGLTARQIEADGFSIDARIECLLSSDTDVGMAKTIGAATLSLADTLGATRPDLLLLIADRYEMLAPAAVALALRIPVAHIEGGEVSEGAIDHAVRNALTSMAHVHLAPTAGAAARLASMGEEPWRIHQVGAPSLDHLRRSALPDRETLERELGMPLDPAPIVVATHPVTIARDTTREAAALFGALEEVDRPVIFCFPNSDAGSHELMQLATRYCEGRDRARLFVNLDPVIYWGLLQNAGAMLGNSSSGIMEAPSLGLPVVNVGMRQQGRERAANIIDVEPTRAAILTRLDEALSDEFRAGLSDVSNPYGDGDSGARITRILEGVPLGEELFVKRAMPVEMTPAAPAQS